MREEAREYYRELGRDYPTRIRQLVPAYDEMADTVAGILAHEVARQLDAGDAEPSGSGISGTATEAAGAEEAPGSPRRILDLGIGEGTLALRVLDALPNARLTGIDGSAEMLERARTRLAGHGDRTELLETDLAGLQPPGPLAAAYSSLTLHNLERPVKSALLERVRRRLAPDAAFVWADLIRHSDPAVQEHFTRHRIELARSRGCPEDFIAWNFGKEGSDDVPLTPEETREIALGAGFRRASPVWVHNVFGVFVLRT